MRGEKYKKKSCFKANWNYFGNCGWNFGLNHRGGFYCAAIENKRFPEYTTTIHKYLPNTELIDKVYDSLASGISVPFEWAVLLGDEWTLHYSLIIGADIPNDKITVANPYGYLEELSVSDFLARTSFEAYQNMPFYLNLGFAFGIFEKNTIFLVQ